MKTLANVGLFANYLWNDSSHEYHFVFAAAPKYALDNNQNKLPEKKEIIEIKQSGSIQEQEKQKSDRWAKITWILW